MELEHDGIWGWGIYDLNGWGIYDLNVWGIYGLSTRTSWDRGRNEQWVVTMHLTKLWKATKLQQQAQIHYSTSKQV